MESPPPYMAPPKKNNTGLIIGLVIGGIFLCCLLPIGLLVGGGVWGLNKIKGTAACAIGFKNIRDAMLDYAHDHGGKLPPAEKWMDEVRPYYKKRASARSEQDGSKLLGSIPVEGAWGCDNGDSGQSGIAFNKELSGKKVDDIKKPGETWILFEVPSPSPNATETYAKRPFDQSPNIFGDHRGWFRVPVSGGVEGAEGKNGKKIEFNTTAG